MADSNDLSRNSMAAKPDEAESSENVTLDSLLDRINTMVGTEEAVSEVHPDSPTLGFEREPQAAGEEPQHADEFFPVEPTSFAKAKLSDTEVEAIILKYLLAIGDASGAEISEHIALPFALVDPFLRQLKLDQLVVHKGSAQMNDYQYVLTEFGMERARRYSNHCAYNGTAPVALEDYIASVEAQTLADQNPTLADLHKAFEGLLLNRRIMDRLGPAINSGRGLFLFGEPGNGKTSIAERITAAFGDHTWIPRAVHVAGEIIQLYDPVNHEAVPLAGASGLLEHRRVDKRWIRIRRPTIIAGGELTMSQLEVTVNSTSGVNEAPLQMKSNCGTLVIDDFGRQKMPVDHLLNRWIVPLEKRYDFLNLPNGMKIRVPFDQLIVFSTNLEPRDLVDEAFLRRIPYKIEVGDPSEQEFRELLRLLAMHLDFEYNEDAIDYLIETHYHKKNRPFRFCHPRDLLLQVANYCAYQNTKRELSEHYLDLACENYFAVM